MAGLTYRDAGVDIDAGERLVDRIKPLAAATRIPEVLAGIGGFAGLCELPSDIENPVLVSGTDGVGTKLKLAFLLNKHDTIGIDLVAMCANDVLTIGARPLFFLDYFGTGKLDVDTGASVVAGIAEGCKQAGCALLGGETAELPGFYDAGEYDLAGFCVGVVDRTKIIDGTRVQTGDAVIGVSSTGLHSNGYSLARRALIEPLEGQPALDLDAPPPGAESADTGDAAATLGELLLRPTRIYAAAARAALATGAVRHLCHVTGGGLPGNLHRGLPDGLGVHLDESTWHPPLVFDLIRQRGDVSAPEMRRTFNMGIGFTVIVAQDDAATMLAALDAAGEQAQIIGEVVASGDAEGEARIRYR